MIGMPFPRHPDHDKINGDAADVPPVSDEAVEKAQAAVHARGRYGYSDDTIRAALAAAAPELTRDAIAAERERIATAIEAVTPGEGAAQIPQSGGAYDPLPPRPGDATHPVDGEPEVWVDLPDDDLPYNAVVVDDAMIERAAKAIERLWDVDEYATDHEAHEAARRQARAALTAALGDDQ